MIRGDSLLSDLCGFERAHPVGVSPEPLGYSETRVEG